MKSRILLVLIAGMFLLTGCTSIAQGNKQYKQRKENARNIITTLEDLGFAGMKGITKHNQIFYSGKVNSYETNFMLDSGAGLTFITYGQALRCGVIDEKNVTREGTLITAYGTMDKGEEVYLDNLSIPGYEFSNWPAHLVESSRKMLIVGQDFLKFNRSILLCNYGILMNNSESEDLTALDLILSEEGYLKLPLRDREGLVLSSDNPAYSYSMFYVKVTINENREGLMLVDTGAAFSSIKDDHSNYRHSAVKRTDMRMMDASGKGKWLFKLKLDSLKIDDQPFLENASVNIIDFDSEEENAAISGFIGMDLLIEKKVILDFGNRVLYFKKL